MFIASAGRAPIALALEGAYTAEEIFDIPPGLSTLVLELEDIDYVEFTDRTFAFEAELDVQVETGEGS